MRQIKFPSELAKTIIELDKLRRRLSEKEDNELSSSDIEDIRIANEKYNTEMDKLTQEVKNNMV